MGLSEKTCEACRVGIPPLDEAEAKHFLNDVPEWQLTHDATRIERRYSFKNFVLALAFVNEVGELSEEQGHHPDITFGWGYALVVYYTHKIKGLHENDFIMAAKADEAYAKYG